jgi:hypothetical protein
MQKFTKLRGVYLKILQFEKYNLQMEVIPACKRQFYKISSGATQQSCLE